MKFTKRQKQLSNCSYSELNSTYEMTERGLNQAAEQGNKKMMDKIMRDHQDVEYALLFKKLKGGRGR